MRTNERNRVLNGRDLAEWYRPACMYRPRPFFNICGCCTKRDTIFFSVKNERRIKKASKIKKKASKINTNMSEPRIARVLFDFDGQFENELTVRQAAYVYLMPYETSEGYFFFFVVEFCRACCCCCCLPFCGVGGRGQRLPCHRLSAVLFPECLPKNKVG